MWMRLRNTTMSSYSAAVDEDFEERPVRQSEELNLTLDGWEGPLDLLLNLARAQKVDLAQISILALVEQYLTYLGQARALKLEIAADYLVMAAWLAYLKSCLLLPKDPEQDPSLEEIALRLQMRLQRLDAMREAGARLLGRDRIGRDVFLRGNPEGLRLVRNSAWQVRDFDLFAAYGVVRARTQPAMHVVHARSVMTLDEAIERVGKMIGAALDWTFLESFLPSTQDPQFRRSCLASSFLAALELARRGRLELAQDEPFAPIRLKRAA
jgi:segregation and condensation protein A